MTPETHWTRSPLALTKALCLGSRSILFPAINGETEAPREIKGLTQAIAQAVSSLGVPLLSSE